MRNRALRLTHWYPRNKVLHQYLLIIACDLTSSEVRLGTTILRSEPNTSPSLHGPSPSSPLPKVLE